MQSVSNPTLSPDPRNGQPREPLPSGTTIRHYRIHSLIASGGMGDVYRAHDTVLDRDVALKILPPELTHDRERIDRFAQEAKAASALSHPHIVTVFEIGHGRPAKTVQPIAKQRTSVVHFIALELIEGHTLREFLATNPGLPRKLELLAQTAEGLAKAHAAGIVHRDLKPDNIMVSADGYAKIVDFGLAKLVEPARGWNPIGADSPTMRAITQQGELIGTAGYMSPEQIHGRDIDQRSDVFSFGCILYEAISGRQPFAGDSFVDTLYHIIHNEPDPLDAPAELQSVVLRCLQKDREQRYQSIRDVAADLRQLATALLVAPPPPRVTTIAPPPSHIGRWALAATCAIAAAALWFATRDTQPSTPVDAPTPRPAVRQLTTSGRVEHLAVSPDGHYVAWIAWDGDQAGIWLQQVATGSSINVVPPTAFMYAGLTFSADSNYLVYTVYDHHPYATVYQIPVLGGAPVKLVTDADSSVSFSPDGNQFAFARDDYKGRASRLMIANRDGASERVLAEFNLPLRTTSPAWAPDGKSIVVARGPVLQSVSVADGKITPLCSESEWRGSIRSVSWTRDGHSLLVSATSERSAGHAQLVRIDLRTKRATPVTDDFDDYSEPATGIDGAELAALQTKSQSNVWLVDRDGTLSQLTRGIGTSDGFGGATWTPDGRILYTSPSAGTVDLWIGDANGGEPRRLTRDPATEHAPRVTADGQRVVYISRESGNSTIWTIALDGSGRRQLTHGPADYEFILTKDSVIYASVDPKTNACLLRAVPIAGGPVRTIANTGVTLSGLTLTPDGKEVVFAAYETESMKVFAVDVNGGTPRRITDTRSYNPAVSPDGTRIACAYESLSAGDAKLAIVPREGGKPLRVLDLHGNRFTWSPDGKAITFVRRAGDVGNLYLQPLDGGPARALTRFPEGGIANYAWSPDGKTIVVTHAVATTDVVVVEK